MPRNPFRSFLFTWAAATVAALLPACSPQSVSVPLNLTVSARQPRTWPSPPIAAPNLPPRIVRIWLSTLTIEPGTWFDGEILVSTNVASVEVRTAAFSINSAHVAPGIYRFHTHVLELPPLSRRHSYQLYIIARNTPGAQRVEEAPLRVE
ncbi:MAG TPA: hypothetical protein VIX60_04610 [Candidatus Cybelea sp.]